MSNYSGLTYNEAENHYRQGVISQDEWEHYCYHWKNESGRFSSLAESYKCSQCPICGQLFDRWNNDE